MDTRLPVYPYTKWNCKYIAKLVDAVTSRSRDKKFHAYMRRVSLEHPPYNTVIQGQTILT